ncbi:integrating conjugative element protein [Pseudomonas sp. PA15(2017)]|uniref:TIGR03749 family integrating conjugative element protein n=1 Tax=Pseudomonas sp. PA15(2017) TaxID=1932111 RepID=UPI000959DEBB|nr:TIGR03749 family integrating conjugative element protein [Pseudomonas sp. PA15(2017)]OLU25508.1 integrating conjugative element protein [Pseudomonas sp. PA15(2017)]
MIRGLLLCVLVAVYSQAVNAVEIFKWNRVPLPIQLGVGHERIVFVDRNVSVGVPRTLQGKLRIQSVAGAVYLLASEHIPPSRLQLKDGETGEIILLDIATLDAAAALEPVKIVTLTSDGSDPQTAEGDTQSGSTGGGTKPSAQSKTPAPVALTRYAAQMMYAPLRTVEPLPGVRQVPLRLSGNLPTLAPTLDMDAIALGAWSLGKWTVTAIRLTNRRAERLLLDPRHLQGDLYAATLQHLELGPAGTSEDTTTAYVVTLDKALELALVPAPADGGKND